jgi:hypothetical protein
MIIPSDDGSSAPLIRYVYYQSTESTRYTIISSKASPRDILRVIWYKMSLFKPGIYEVVIDKIVEIGCIGIALFPIEH